MRAVEKAILVGAAVGLGVLFLNSQADPIAQGTEKETSPETADPLPDFPLSQLSILEATIEAMQGRKEKLASVLHKASKAGTAIRAYLLAMLRSVPKQLKEDSEFRKEFDRAERRRIQALKNDPTLAKLDTFGRVARALGAAVSTLIPVAGPALWLAIDKLLIPGLVEGVKDDFPDANTARKAEAAIYPGFEGLQLLRGVSIDAPRELPNITRADTLKRDSIRRSNFAEAVESELFKQLPIVPDRTAFRFSPTWEEFKSALNDTESRS